MIMEFQIGMLLIAILADMKALSEKANRPYVEALFNRVTSMINGVSDKVNANSVGGGGSMRTLLEGAGSRDTI